MQLRSGLGEESAMNAGHQASLWSQLHSGHNDPQVCTTGEGLPAVEAKTPTQPGEGANSHCTGE